MREGKGLRPQPACLEEFLDHSVSQGCTVRQATNERARNPFRPSLCLLPARPFLSLLLTPVIPELFFVELGKEGLLDEMEGISCAFQELERDMELASTKAEEKYIRMRVDVVSMMLNVRRLVHQSAHIEHHEVV